MTLGRQTHIISYVITVLLCFVTLSFISNVVYADNNLQVTAKTGDGLHTVTIDTPQGKIRVNLPDDMSAGDTISGTVVAEPRGANTDEIRKNSDELNGYVVEIKMYEKELGETQIGQGKLTGVPIPGDLSGGPAQIVLSDTKDEEILVSDIAVRDSPHPMQYTEKPSPQDYKLPIVGRTGEPLQILGPFDGTFDTTVVKIGGKETELLAESPRKLIARAPGGIEGPTKIEVIERGVEVKGDFYNADINKPSAVKTLDGIWRTESGKSSWRISQSGQAISADSVLVSKEDEIRGYKPNVNIVRGQLRGNLIQGKIEQFFTIPIEECMAMCPGQCEQWNELMLVLSEDGNMLKGQIQEKALDTGTCTVVEFGWRPWAMIAEPSN